MKAGPFRVFAPCLWVMAFSSSVDGTPLFLALSEYCWMLPLKRPVASPHAWVGQGSALTQKVPLWFSAAHWVALPSAGPFYKYNPLSWTAQTPWTRSSWSSAQQSQSLSHPHPLTETGNFECENIKAVSNLGNLRAHSTVPSSQGPMSFVAWYSVLWNYFFFQNWKHSSVVKGLPWICKALGSVSRTRGKIKAELLLNRLVRFYFESFWLFQAGKQLLFLGLPSFVEAELSKETCSLLLGVRTHLHTTK